MSNRLCWICGGALSKFYCISQARSPERNDHTQHHQSSMLSCMKHPKTFVHSDCSCQQNQIKSIELKTLLVVKMMNNFRLLLPTDTQWLSKGNYLTHTHSHINKDINSFFVTVFAVVNTVSGFIPSKRFVCYQASCDILSGSCRV